MNEWIPATKENVMKYLCDDFGKEYLTAYSPLAYVDDFEFSTEGDMIITQCHLIRIVTKPTGEVDDELEEIVDFDYLVVQLPFNLGDLRVNSFRRRI